MLTASPYRHFIFSIVFSFFVIVGVVVVPFFYVLLDTVILFFPTFSAFFNGWIFYYLFWFMEITLFGNFYVPFPIKMALSTFTVIFSAAENNFLIFLFEMSFDLLEYHASKFSKENVPFFFCCCSLFYAFQAKRNPTLDQIGGYSFRLKKNYDCLILM